VLIGLLIPALIELYYLIPKLVYHRGFTAPRTVDIAVSVAVLLGGSGPVGI